MKYIKQICSALLAFCLLCTASATALAHEIPDENQKGTVTVKMEYDGRAVTGGTLTAYRVGRIQEDDGNYSFEKTDDMSAFSGSYTDIGSAALAEELAAFVRENGISACAAAENQNGKAIFTDLELGLYLIVQTKASKGYEPLKPFLISVPMNEDGQYVYETEAEGKFELHREPKPGKPSEPTEPDTPTGPKEPSNPAGPSGPFLPQTGQLNWPVPVLAALGLCLFSVGWMLRFGKKNEYEK